MPHQSEAAGVLAAIGAHFDATINLGHLLTIFAMLIPLAVWGARLESRVDHEADLRTRLEAQTQTSLSELKTMLSARDNDVRYAVRDLGAKIERINDLLFNIAARQGSMPVTRDPAVPNRP